MRLPRLMTFDDQDDAAPIDEVFESAVFPRGARVEPEASFSGVRDELAEVSRAIGAAAGATGEGQRMVDASARGDAAEVVGGAAVLAGNELVTELGDRSPETLSSVSFAANVLSAAAADLEERAEDFTEWTTGAEEAVSYSFSSAAAPTRSFEVCALEIEEALSAPYRLRIELAVDDRDFDPLSLLGTDALVRLERGARHRRCQGVVQEVVETSLREAEQVKRFTLEIAPALALAALRRDSRVFQDMSVPAILTQVLGECLQPYGREARLELTDEYRKREYCVQYDEASLDFVHRLMEEEGIFYGFEHEGDAETLVLFDNNASLASAPLAGREWISYVPRTDLGASGEAIFAFTAAVRSVSTATVFADYDWTRQGDMRVREELRGTDALGRELEVYEHRTRAATLTDYDEGIRKYQEHDVPRQTQIRHELRQRDVRDAEGIGRAIGFRPGTTFALQGHPNVGADGRYLLTRVNHRKAPHAGASVGDSESYHNTFSCIPVATPYRPSRCTPKPRIHGAQTGRVVGPAGEEIHTDAHGRIRVELAWDRRGECDERSSCWIRVQQAWAGAGWGSLFLPRVGMEVVVTYLDGDPDRPLVTGCVYNGDHPPPYPLPGDKTKSTLRTQSSPGGGGYNELRFEDRSGSEEVFLHAQKDLNEVVGHNHSTTIGNDQAIVVGANQTEGVGANQSVTVGADQTLSVVGNRTKTVVLDETNLVEGNRTTRVALDETTVVTGTRTLQVKRDETVAVTGRQELTVTGPTLRTHQGGQQTTVQELDRLIVAGGADRHVEVSGRYVSVVEGPYLVQQAGAEQILLDGRVVVRSETSIELQAPGCVVRLEGGKVQLDAAKELTLTCGDASVGLKSDGTIEVKGAAKVQLEGGGAKTELSKSGVVMNGNMLELTAQAIAKLNGTMVKIN